MEIPTVNTDIRQEISGIFQAQQAYAPELARTTAGERIRKLNRIEAYLKQEDRFRELCEAMDKDFRKPPAEVFSSETGVVLAQITHTRRNLRRWMRPHRVASPLAMAGTSSYILPEPKGVALIIAPWNYPLNLAMGPLVSSIAAGNAAIIKPSEMAANTSAYIRKMIETLFEAREVAVIEGDAEVSQALLELPFNHIHFTGSPQVGKIVMAAAARHLASVTLELGGKSPAIVDQTVDAAAFAAKAAWAKHLNNGQTCIAPDYMIVHESVKETFIAGYRKAIDKMYNPNGQGIQQSPDLARVVNDRHFQRLKRLLDDAVAKGATVEAGGEVDPADRFISPTLLTGVTEDMEILQEEVFGPIMPMLTYRSREEVVGIIRRRPKPLAFYIASRDRGTVDYILRESSAGGTLINEYLLGFSNPNLPFGGVNNSGIGRAFGQHGFREFSNERSIIRRWIGDLSFLFPPFNAWTLKLLKFFYYRLY